MKPSQPSQPAPSPAGAGHAYIQDFQNAKPGAPNEPAKVDPKMGLQSALAAAPKVNPNSTQNSLEIAEIRDGIVIMNDGTYRSVIMVKSINFDLMSPQEKEAVEFSYQGFLNSLYFHIQIFIHSQKVDLGPYIAKLTKISNEHDNMLLAVLMEDYIAFMDDLSHQTNIMDKKFYVIIPYYPKADVQQAMNATKKLFKGVGVMATKKQNQLIVIDETDLETAKEELRNRVQSVLGGLLQCGVQGLPLDTQELIELYYDVYNPDTATRQPLKNFDELIAPIVGKGVGNAPTPNLDRELK